MTKGTPFAIFTGITSIVKVMTAKGMTFVMQQVAGGAAAVVIAAASAATFVAWCCYSLGGHRRGRLCCQVGWCRRLLRREGPRGAESPREYLNLNVLRERVSELSLQLTRNYSNFLDMDWNSTEFADTVLLTHDTTR